MRIAVGATYGTAAEKLSTPTGSYNVGISPERVDEAFQGHCGDVVKPCDWCGE